LQDLTGSILESKDWMETLLFVATGIAELNLFNFDRKSPKSGGLPLNAGLVFVSFSLVRETQLYWSCASLAFVVSVTFFSKVVEVKMPWTEWVSTDDLVSRPIIR
jgi:phosphatidylserine synthase